MFLRRQSIKKVSNEGVFVMNYRLLKVVAKRNHEFINIGLKNCVCTTYM